MEPGRIRIRRSIPESVVVEIIARLPLRSIARFKSVCKQWRSLIEPSYFRSLFVSLHRNSSSFSSLWSLMFPIKFQSPITEAIGGWAFKQLRSPCPLQGSGFSRSMNLDGTVYVWDKRVDEDDTSL
ncbi:hypothetical protein F2Q69_00046630 [Brassica cretica]|uniref:F-box domain-containing protein n=1 Tax=Brassica cretica TaxID=69181 RepID=A0A8S9PYU4_BRACR|nr:hypothetical protein F2Q69_00046630 [Brassica cretica]